MFSTRTITTGTLFTELCFSVRQFVCAILVLSSQRFSIRWLVCAVLVLSSQCFSVRQFVCTVISLISTFLRVIFSPNVFWYVSSIVQYQSYLYNVSRWCYLFNVSWYVSSFVQCQCYVFNVSPYRLVRSYPLPYYALSSRHFSVGQFDRNVSNKSCFTAVSHNVECPYGISLVVQHLFACIPSFS